MINFTRSTISSYPSVKSNLLSGLFLPLIYLCALVALNGCKKDSTTSSSTPVIITDGLISNVTATTAQSGGIITNASGVTASGVCYSSSDPTPTTADSKTNDAGTADAEGTTSFTSTLTGLTSGATYYVRAYVVNGSGTSYGSVIKFATNPAIGTITTTVSTFAGSTIGGYADGTGKNALFKGPQSVATDAAGNVYVADASNNVIREIPPGGVVSTYAGNGTQGYANGTPANMEFNSPQGVAFDASGSLYVTDFNNVIRKITAAGVVTTFAGNSKGGYVNGQADTTEFHTPEGIAVDASGNVYVADRANDVIRKINTSDKVITFSGLTPGVFILATTTAGYVNGVASGVLFRAPKDIAVNSQGISYVADENNFCIRTLDASGTASTLAGSPTETTTVGSPSAVALDAKGNLYIADEFGRILEITTSNVLYVLAGSSNTYGYVDGPGTSAQFNGPQGIAVDASGNIYVADYNNNVIRKIVVTITAP